MLHIRTIIGVVFLAFTFGAVLNRKEPRPANPNPYQDNPTGVGPNSPGAARQLRSQTEAKFNIGPGERQFLTVDLSARQYVRLFIEHSDVDLRVIAATASGNQLADFVCVNDGPTFLSLVSASGEQIRLEVRNDSSKLAANYSMRLDQPRQLVANDSLRVAAELSFHKAELLRREWTERSMQSALLDYEEALRSFQEAGDHVATVLALKSIAKTYQSLDQINKAIDYYNRAQSLAKAIPNRAIVADILNDLAYLYFAFGDNDKALARSTNALQLSQGLRHGSGEARAAFLVGEAHYGLGDLTKALSYYNQGLEGSRELKNYRQQIQILVACGYSYGELGEIHKAGSSYDKALALALDLGDARWRAITLRALGNLQTNLGEKQKALDHLHKAWDTIQNFSDSPSKAAILGALGYIYDSTGEYRLALQYYSGARTLFLAMGHRWGAAEVEMEVGKIHTSLGKPEVALDYYDSALKSFRVLGMRRYQAQTLKNIGLAHELMGDSRKAVDYLDRSLGLNRAGQDQRYEAYTLNYLGRVYHNSKDYKKALECYNRALALTETAADIFGKSQTLYNVATTERALGNLDEALAHSKQSLSIVESLRTKVASQYLRTSYLASVHQHYELQINILMGLNEKYPSQGFTEAAFEASERARARSLLETLTETHANIRQGVDPALLEREQELQQQLNSKAARQLRLLSSGAKEEGEDLDLEIRTLTSEHQGVEGQIRSTSPRYAALTQPQPLSLKEIQQQVLDENSLLLEYSLGDERSYLWAVTRTEVSNYELPGRGEVERAARNVYNSLTANQPKAGETFEERQTRVVKANEQLQSHIATLSQILLEPVSPKLGTKRLLIVPDGALQYIPFQILNLTESRPLVADHEIINEPSASALALLVSEAKNRKPAPNSVAVFADPVFEADDPRIVSAAKPAATSLTAQAQETELHRALRDVSLSGDGVHIPRLQASQDEADAIMSLTPWWSGFKAMGFEASRATAMGSDLGDYRIIHFATHGFLNDEHPELSGVVLSLFDEKGQTQEGFLRLHDIYNLRLPVDLVVLSACNTGLGKDVKGEGLIGLTRGFMYAGASSVVASLWKVDDEATAELMRLFYGYMLRDGLSPAAALRNAQVTMSQQKRWQSPYYWAGFVIQGQYLQNERTSRFPIPRLALLLFAAAVVGAAAVYALKRRRKIAL